MSQKRRDPSKCPDAMRAPSSVIVSEWQLLAHLRCQRQLNNHVGTTLQLLVSFLCHIVCAWPAITSLSGTMVKYQVSVKRTLVTLTVIREPENHSV